MIEGTEINVSEDYSVTKILQDMICEVDEDGKGKLFMHMTDGTVFCLEGSCDDVREYYTAIGLTDFVDVCYSCLSLSRIK